MSMRWDWTHVFSRASTWLALLSLSAVGGLGAYALMPERAQLLMPDWMLIVLSATAVGSAVLTPVATSFKQKGHGSYSKVEITTTTKVEGDVGPEKAAELVEAAAPTTEVSDAGRS